MKKKKKSGFNLFRRSITYDTQHVIIHTRLTDILADAQKH